jgi:hypothetical protein
MSLTFLQFAQRLHRESGRSTAAPTAVSGATAQQQRYFDRIADAWRELQTEREWRWMRGKVDSLLVASQQGYTGTAILAASTGTPTRFRRWRMQGNGYMVRIYVDGSKNTLADVPYWDVDDFRPYWIDRTFGPAWPVAWTFDEANDIYFGPAPIAGMRVRAEYWKSPTELAADADVTDMPSEFELVVLWKALQQVAIDDGAQEVLARANANYSAIHFKLLMDQAWLPTA